MDRNVKIITDLNGDKIVLINDIIFEGKRNVNWKKVKDYLKVYVDEIYQMYLYDILDIKKETSNPLGS